jgi:hypothetical protein
MVVPQRSSVLTRRVPVMVVVLRQMQGEGLRRGMEGMREGKRR